MRAVFAVAALYSLAITLSAQETRASRPTMPDFPTDAEWINTVRPLSLQKELKGHIVLLDFWTYCCINCLHILPDLDDLESRFRDVPFVVVGVHSAKFDNENVPANVRAAVRRHHITHPVLVDTRQDLWKRLGVRAWPTLILIDSEGRGVRSWSGEGNKEEIALAIADVAAEGKMKGTLAPTAWRPDPPGSLDTRTGLQFPGKVIGSAESGRLIIADSSANRIIEASWPTLEGESRLIRVIGTGHPARKDGPANEAQFRFPQGMALVENVLWVADTDNHAIRRIELATGEVSTLVGNGVMGNDRTGGDSGMNQRLNSPWDIAASSDSLIIAMAGTHQLWKVDVASRVATRFSGSGRENLRDGEASMANFAQPSGLAWLDGDLLVADSETSAIRRVTSGGKATTVIGEGLFDFGDVDGALGQARLQHPLGIGVMKGVVTVADTYNSKVKRLDIGKNRIESWALKFSSEPKSLAEPGGISGTTDRWLVADTNHHRILQILPDGQAIEIRIEGLRADSRPTTQPGGKPR